MTSFNLTRIASLFLNILFPEKCLGCKKGGTFLCDECITTLPSAETESLPRGITALFAYRNNITRKAIRALKYRGARSVAKTFAVPLYEELLAELGEDGVTKKTEPIMLMPVPLSAKKLRERGFNQSERLVQEMARLGGGVVAEPRMDVVRKIKDTPSQTSFRNKKARLNNVRGCFAVVKPKEVRGRHIIIIDDVCTTGATIHEIRKVLKAAGAKKISAITVAH